MARSNRGFGATSRQDRQEADQFLADLLGTGPSRSWARPLAGRVASRAEAWQEDPPAADVPRRLVQDPKRGYGWILPTPAALMRAAARPPVPSGTRPTRPSEEIFGTDDRQRVADTTPIAFRFVCCLDLIYAHPTDPSLSIQLRGTGTLISERHVLTCAHNLLHTIPGFASAGRLRAARVFASPGRNGRVLPFGESQSVTLRVPPEWTAAPNAQFDFALITLQDAIGAVAQPALGGAPLGFWSHPRLGGGTHIRPLDVGFLPGRPVNLDGYPSDKCGDQPPDRPATAAEIAACTGSVAGNPRLTDVGSTQWRSFGNVVEASPATEPRAITYDLDSAVGHSGGPIWLRWERYRNLVAVNTGGYPRPVAPFDIIANMGVRITNELLQTIRAWMTADGVRATF